MDGSTQAECAKCGGRVVRTDNSCPACGVAIRFATQEPTVPVWARAFILAERLTIALLLPILLAYNWKKGSKPANLGFLIFLWLGVVFSNDWSRCDAIYARRRIIGYAVIALSIWAIWYFILRPFSPE